MEQFDTSKLLSLADQIRDKSAQVNRARSSKDLRTAVVTSNMLKRVLEVLEKRSKRGLTQQERCEIIHREYNLPNAISFERNNAEGTPRKDVVKEED